MRSIKGVLNDMEDYVDTELILRPEDFLFPLDEQKIPEFDEKSVFILTLIEVNRHLQYYIRTMILSEKQMQVLVII